MNFSLKKLIRLGLLFLTFIMAIAGLSIRTVHAEETGPEPQPQIEPTPYGAVGSCELSDGSWETCYDPMCETAWHEPQGEQGVWVQRVVYGFRGCNPYDGCVYTTLTNCENGCDTSDPFNHTCGGGIDPADDPDNQDHPNGDSDWWEDPDDQDHPNGDVDYWEDPDNQDHPNGDVDYWEDPANDLCYGIYCADAVCSGDVSYYGGGQCDPSDGICAYPYTEDCIDGCNEATGRCFEFDGEGYCASNPCETHCVGDVSWHSGQCDPEDGGCFYTQETCENGCDSSTGYCIAAETNLCAGVSCPSVCVDGESYYNGTCDPADGNCIYTVTSCEHGCDSSTGYCLDPSASGLCAGVSCPNFCEGDTSWHDGKCDPEDGQCVYYTTYCETGCWEASGLCVPESGGEMGDLLGILAVGGGVLAAGGGAAGGGLLLYRFLKGRKPPIPKPSTPVPEPRLPAVEPILEDLAGQRSRVDDLLERLNNIDRHRLGHEIEFNQRMAEISERKLDVINMFDSGTQYLKKAADFGADIVGLAPGVGRQFKYVYKGVTNFLERSIETYIEDGSVLGAASSGLRKGALEAGKAVIGDRIGDYVPVPGINDLGRIGKDYAAESVRSIIRQKGAANIALNIAKDQYVSQGVNQGEKLVKVIMRHAR